MAKFFSKELKGFTLVELLVVIGIIVLMATIGLTVIAHYRDKAKDIKIEIVLSQLRRIAALVRDDNGSFNLVCKDGDTGDNGNDKTLNESISALANIEEEIENLGQSVTCYDAVDSFCTSSSLITGGTYCVDSTGYAGTGSTTCDASTVCY